MVQWAVASYGLPASIMCNCVQCAHKLYAMMLFVFFTVTHTQMHIEYTEQQHVNAALILLNE